jgi:hypothetical protein
MTVALTYTELKTPPILTTPYSNSLGGNTAQYESKHVGGMRHKRKQSKRNRKQSKRNHSKKNRKTRRRSCKN